ncbi:hypothetical protein B0H14DRAFT_2606507 [Mycena olivaceomarginata]|nr:hypothetical protein B0H14DRAFT_2606507 [Mycena olivaceomarginata]
MPPRRQPAPAAVADAPAKTPAQTPKCTQRARRAPIAPDKTPPPPPPPAQTKTRRQRRQPAPPAEPVPAPPVEPASIPAGPERPPVEPDRVGDGDGHAAARPRDIFDDDDPEGAAAGAAPRPYVHFAGRDSNDGEYFPDPPASPSRSPSPHVNPHPSVADADDRLGLVHIPPQCPRHTAKGLTDPGLRKMCGPSSNQRIQKGRRSESAYFATSHNQPTHSTSTGILRRHLYEHHVDAWVEGCDRLKIPIKAKEA